MSWAFSCGSSICSKGRRSVLKVIRKAKKEASKRNGHWKIDIEGQGPDHNINYPDDVDKLVDQFLLTLRRHDIVCAEHP